MTTNNLICYMMIATLSLSMSYGCTNKLEDKEKHDVHTNSDSYALSTGDVNIYIKQAEKGNADAARRLANYYYILESDSEKGFYWNERAAKNGNTDAQLEVGRDYMIGDNPTKRINFIKARHWLQLAAQSGDLQAKEYLSLLLSKNEIKQLSKIAIEGDATVAYRLYLYYYYVEREHKDKEMYWLKIAAQNGNNEAQYDLGLELETIDKQKAIYWISKAASQGHSRAKEVLERLKGK